jgi:hypothetical protein
MPEVERNRLSYAARHGLIGFTRKLLRNSQRDVWPISGHAGSGRLGSTEEEIRDRDDGCRICAGRALLVRLGKDHSARQSRHSTVSAKSFSASSALEAGILTRPRANSRRRKAGSLVLLDDEGRFETGCRREEMSAHC